VGLADDVVRIAAAAQAYASDGEEPVAVLPVEAAPGERLYLCAFAAGEEVGTWLALDDQGAPVTSRKRVRDATSIAALCEVAEESTGAGPSREPRVASAAYLDSLGANAGEREAVGALQAALPAVEELARDVEGNYKLELT
jgi:hypothetical protein